MRKLAVLLHGLALAPGAASAQSIGGKYAVKRTNHDGSPYEGTAEVTQASPTTCLIHWKSGETASDGIYMPNGNAFSAACVIGDSNGLLVYQVM